jgi:sulfatase modifying factor 1
MRRIASAFLVTAGLIATTSWLACGGDAFTTRSPASAPPDASMGSEGASMPPSPVTDASVEEGGVIAQPPHDGSTSVPNEASVSTTGCPTGRGPAMVVADSFCIDSTEVTSAQYNDFLLAGPALTGQPSACSWNSSYLPGNGWTYTPSEATLPIASVNWCQAHAFCEWAGKHLCGKVGGGSADFANFASSDNEHYMACSNASTRIYPYGNAFQPDACNGTERDAGQVLPVGSLSGCQGGVPGLFDMSGNVEEWQDACQSNSGPDDQCLDGTGAFDYGDPPTGTRCDFADSDMRNGQYPDLGFRCCATLP